MKTAIAISPMMRNVLERGEDPAPGRDGTPDGEDRAQDCPDDPARAPIMRPAPAGRPQSHRPTAARRDLAAVYPSVGVPRRARKNL